MKRYGTAALAGLAVLVLADAPAGAQIRIEPPRGSGGAPPAAGGSNLLTISADVTLRVMRNAGFGRLEPYQNNGQSHVKAVIDGVDTFIWHESCEGKNCVTLNFAAYFGKQDQIDAAYMNDYNLNTFYAKMAKTRDGILVLTMAVSVYRGVTEEHVLEMGKVWISVFKEAVVYKPKP